LLDEGTHQYVKVFGSANYLKAIAGFHQKNFKGHDLENKIIAVNGGSEALYCCIMGLVNEGEEVVIFEPASECYRPQVQMAGGKTIGVQLTPKKRVILLAFSIPKPN
jgi:aspartate/methionine/tyrosine aminotransferase